MRWSGETCYLGLLETITAACFRSVELRGIIDASELRAGGGCLVMCVCVCVCVLLSDVCVCVCVA